MLRDWLDRLPGARIHRETRALADATGLSYWRDWHHAMAYCCGAPAWRLVSDRERPAGTEGAVREALAWYAERATAMNRYMTSKPPKAEAMTAVAQELALDAGQRAKAVLSVPAGAESWTRDDPDLDGTDWAHPAWWRGHEHTSLVFCDLVTKILDGQDDGGGFNHQPWHDLRQRLLKLVMPSQSEAERAVVEAAKRVVALPNGSARELAIADMASKLAALRAAAPDPREEPR